jgi:5-methylcytosine-specific restriction endonuclease McrA
MVCHLCGGPFTTEDPPVADHVLPRAYGRSDDLSNLAPPTGRKGAQLPGWSAAQ